VHLVDADTRQLAQALLIETTAEQPPTSRTFEACGSLLGDNGACACNAISAYIWPDMPNCIRALATHAVPHACWLQVQVPVGGIVQKRTTYANTHSRSHTFHFASSHPEVLSFRPASMQLAPGGTAALGMVFDGAGLTAGRVVEVLVFVSSEETQGHDCMLVKLSGI
jgi:hypothetical protein